MLPKFRFQMAKAVVVMDDAVKDRVNRFKLTIPEYEPWEMIMRPVPNWNTEQMRKFFHGPVRDFVRAKERENGSVKSKEEIKSDLKLIYGPREDKNIGKKTVQVCKSTGDYTFKEYTQFLMDIDAFCQDNYKEGLPLNEEIAS